MAPDQTTPKDDLLQFLRACLRLIPALLEFDGVDDVVFVTIDFENHQNLRKQLPSQKLNSQVGIAVFDTRDLFMPLRQSPVKTLDLVTGSRPYYVKTTRKFLFGDSILTYRHNLGSKLENLISRTRNIFLVGHGFGGDLKYLQTPDFDLHKTIVGILDSQKMGQPGNSAKF